MIETQRQVLRPSKETDLEKLGFRREGLYKEFVSFVNDEQGNPVYENTYEFAVLKKEWSQK